MRHDLRSRIRGGDSAAFAGLFDTYAAEIHRYGWRLTGDAHQAEEVLSLTFLEAWRLRATIRGGGDSLRPWLYAIALNVTRNQRRAARRHRAALRRLPAPETTPDFADDVIERDDQRDRLERARIALARLNENERELIALCVWQGLSYAEASEALQIPVGTVRSRLSRARGRLEQMAATTPPESSSHFTPRPHEVRS